MMFSLSAEVEELAHAAELFVAAVYDLAGTLLRQDEEVALQHFAQKFCGAFVVGVSATVWLGNDFVDDPEIFEISGHNLHGDSGGFGFSGIAPDDGGATF